MVHSSALAIAGVVLVGVGLPVAAGRLPDLAKAQPATLTVSHASPAAAAPVLADSAASPVAEVAPFVVVDIVGRDYAPKGLTVERGTTVFWVNEDGNAHTATAFDGAFDSGNMSRGAVYSVAFEEPGRYPYGCDYHLDMGGSVTVTE